MSKAKFRITITDNENNTVLIDRDSDCIIGAIDLKDEEKTAGLGYTQCSLDTVMQVVESIGRALRELTDNDPILRMAVLHMAVTLVGGHDDED